MKTLWQGCRWKRHCLNPQSLYVIHCEPIIDPVLFPVKENTFYVKVKDMMRIRRWETFLQCSSGTSGVRHKVFLFVGKNFQGEADQSQSLFSFEPLEKNISVKLARLMWGQFLITGVARSFKQTDQRFIKKIITEFALFTWSSYFLYLCDDTS